MCATSAAGLGMLMSVAADMGPGFEGIKHSTLFSFKTDQVFTQVRMVSFVLLHYKYILL